MTDRKAINRTVKHPLTECAKYSVKGLMNANIRKERIAMDKKYIRQPSADDTSKIGSKPGLLHTIAEKIFTAFGMMLLLSIPLFIIGKALGADRPFELLLCLPFPLSVVPVCLLFPFSDFCQRCCKGKGICANSESHFCSLFCNGASRFPASACAYCRGSDRVLRPAKHRAYPSER